MGETATIDLALADIDTTSADYSNFVSAVNAVVGGRSDLSFDGKTILFAYCECGKATSDWRSGWGVETCFHLFKVNVDGTNLMQLTDGELNDFDPCWLPNGRICFISERRGGYGRCHGGRDAPSYTLCSINPDGSCKDHIDHLEPQLFVVQ